jgi:hypothetical protein
MQKESFTLIVSTIRGLKARLWLLMSTAGALLLYCTHATASEDEQLVQPLGMDGQYRHATVNGAAVSAGRAEWFEDRDLELVFSEPTEFGIVKARGARVASLDA